MTFLLSSMSIAMAVFAPTMAFVAVNTEYFSRRQMVNSFLLAAGSGLILGGAFHLATNLFLYPFFSEHLAYPLLAVELTACGASLGIFLILSERMVSELLSRVKVRLYCILSLTAIFLASTYLISIAVLDCALVVYIALSSFDYIKNVKDKSRDVLDGAGQNSDSSDTDADTEFKHRPNVYVLFLESFHSGDALKSLYGMDNHDLCEHMTSNGFTLYEDVFSNHPLTALSFSSMVWPDSLYNINIFGQSAQLPPSRVFSAFKRNGYRLNLVANDFLSLRFSSLFHQDSDTVSSLESCMHEQFAPILAQSSFLRRWLSTVDIFKSTIDNDGLFKEFKAKISNGLDRPQLHWFHFGASHSPVEPYDQGKDFGDIYPKVYRQAEDRLRQTVDLIMESDPDPLIVAIGDHGAYRYRYAEKDGGKDPNVVIRSRGFEPKLIAKDICSVFLGIRWPVANYTEGAVMSHARVLDHVIAALCEDEQLTRDMAPNRSFLGIKEYGVAIIAEDGRLLDEWKRLTPDDNIPALLHNVKKNPQDMAIHLSLAVKYFELGQKKEGLDYLLQLCEKFPTSETVFTEASRRMLEYDSAKAAELARTAITISPTSAFAHYCLAIAEEQENSEAYHGHFQKALQYNSIKTLPKDVYLRYAFSIMKTEDYVHLSSAVNMMEEDAQEDVVNAIDWQMAYRAHLRGSNEGILEWLDKVAAKGPSERTKDALGKKLIVCIQRKKWKETEVTARALLEIQDTHIGACMALANSLECQNRLGEALQTLAAGVQSTQHGALLDILGTMADRHRVLTPSLAPFKVLAREQMAKRARGWAKAARFDEQWYAARYGQLLNGLSPIEHYMQYSMSMMLNPNADFDTGFYYSNNPDVFKSGVDASVHYNQHGCHELSRPRAVCLCEPLEKVDVHWRTARAS